MMPNNRNLLWVLLLGIFLSACTAQAQKSRKFMLLSYNVENLFDTIPTGHTLDQEFTPQGAKEWTSSKYHHKVKQLSRVISSVNGWELPAIMCFVEVENKKVVSDLLRKSLGNDFKHYEIAITSGSDSRGIEVAMAWDKRLFKRHQQQDIPNLGKGSRKWTKNEPSGRHSLFLTLVTKPERGMKLSHFQPDTLHLIGTHMPSRRGGVKATEGKRKQTIRNIKRITDQLQDRSPHSKIIVMGDMNENPTDPAMRIISNLKKGGFYNLSFSSHKSGEYTHVHKGQRWFPDQMLITTSLLDATEGLRIDKKSFGIYSPEYLFSPQSKGKRTRYPFRSFQGNHYVGGFSDHLPIYVYLTLD